MMETDSLTMEIKCPVTETYQDVEMMIHKVVHTFLRKKNIVQAEYEEWHSEACVAFSETFQSFDRHKGNRFTTWLWWNIWHTLSDKLQKEAPQWMTFRLSEKLSANLTDERQWKNSIRSNFDIQSLSDDARVVTRIVLDTFGCVDGREEKPEEIRMALYNLLCGMGWSGQRVLESFSEIRTALTG